MAVSPSFKIVDGHHLMDSSPKQAKLVLSASGVASSLNFKLRFCGHWVTLAAIASKCTILISDLKRLCLTNVALLKNVAGRVFASTRP